MSDGQILTEADLDEIEARAERATPGRWVTAREAGAPWNVETEHDGQPVALAFELVNDGLRQPRRTANAEFIAHSREDVRRLVAEVRWLRPAGAGEGD